jgi:lipopolysaccharide biosynthesis glycosyltransferase
MSEISAVQAPATGREWPLFIGCACDRKFVEPTATMLTSVDQNGEVPDATVVLAAFGLDELDRATLRAAAGRLGERMIFLDVTPDLLGGIDASGYIEAYPLPVLGRLFIPDVIGKPGARLLTLDSDMVVLTSLRLFTSLDMGGRIIAAAHDAPRDYDPDYFNSGIMLIDVDAYKRNDIARRALGWLVSQSSAPRFPDQDALNHVIGGDWLRLDRLWNHFCYAPNHFEPADWAAGYVAHFAGPKPWVQPGHGGEQLYYGFNAEVHRKLAAAGLKPRFRRSPRIDALLTWSGRGTGAAIAAAPPILEGVACDRDTVACTAALLTSLDLNGRLPEAEVLVAGFDLDNDDERMLRAAAGDRTVRFVDLRQRIAEVLDHRTTAVPMPVLARLLLPEQVEAIGARMLVLESATIVNADLRPLVHRDLGANFFAAVPDQRSTADRVRFAVGAIMIDVDGYRYHDIGARALRWVGDHGGSSAAPDQDALNEVVGVQWHRLAQTWNLFRQGAVPLTPEDYETCRIARFHGDMPWNDERHPGARLYHGYAGAARARAEGVATARATGQRVSRAFVGICYEMFLGRELEDEQVAADRAHLSPERLIASVVDSEEFRGNVARPLAAGEDLPSHIFRYPLERRHLDWARDELPLSIHARAIVTQARDWAGLLSIVLGDDHFAKMVGIDALPALPALAHVDVS